jgi:tRNA pseudouridine55 synthase
VRSDAGNRPRSGLALLRKPEGLTSFQALSPVKRRLSSGKVGHAGTLDRFASGLLVILCGSYSRLASYVVAGEKHYRGLVAFGEETSTLDPEGEVIASAPVPTRADLEAVLPAFRGPILQRPPLYSALHVDGKRAYQLAREGLELELKERRVEIHSLELISYEEGRALIDVRCSSGTYIRSLARDLALAAASRAHLVALERLSIGPYSVLDAVSPQDFEPERDLRDFSAQDASKLGLRTLALHDEGLALLFLNGGRIAPGAFQILDGGRSAVGCEAAVFGSEAELLGIISLELDGPVYRCVMPLASAQALRAGRSA